MLTPKLSKINNKLIPEFGGTVELESSLFHLLLNYSHPIHCFYYVYSIEYLFSKVKSYLKRMHVIIIDIDCGFFHLLTISPHFKYFYQMTTDIPLINPPCNLFMLGILVGTQSPSLISICGFINNIHAWLLEKNCLKTRDLTEAVYCILNWCGFL